MASRPSSLGIPQQSLPFVESSEASTSVGLTFRDSKTCPIHRWYPYVEGFSADYVYEKLLSYGKGIKTVYDPFGGAGTVQLEASKLGIPSYFSEVNPFMAFIALTKVNSANWAHNHLGVFEDCSSQFVEALKSSSFRESALSVSLDDYKSAFPDRNFFVETHLKELIAARELAIKLSGNYAEIKNLFLLAIAAKVVSSSHMTRRADLRRRRPDEYKTRVVDTVEYISSKVNEIVQDIKQAKGDFAETQHISNDARSVANDFDDAFSIAITSPPYLNGTNYFRNTKLELWFLSYIKTEDDLKGFYRRAVAGGINNVSKDKTTPHQFESVERVASVLDKQTLDSRIPKLVRGYFSDMFEVLNTVYRSLISGGRFIVDIGDSKFYGVHVPTDKLLVDVAHEVGFEVESLEMLARRYSRDKSPLQQVEVVLRKTRSTRKAKANKVNDVREYGGKPKNTSSTREAINHFRSELPYKSEPFSKKSWGHHLHSLCSYQGKLKPAIAHWLIHLFTESGMSVLDPLGGVGTIGFEACLQGRKGFSNDLSPLASVIAQAKLCPPPMNDALAALGSFKVDMARVKLTDEDYTEAEFGLNAKVKDYFHPDTLNEVLAARKLFLQKQKLSDTEAFLKACVLHILHGNRPYALSRQSHPLTPYNPRGEFEYKSVTQKLEERIRRILADPLPDTFVSGHTFNENFRALREVVPHSVDRIITSPPFIGMRFDRPNWMRLWFCGWKASDFHSTHERFLERQQMKSMEVYSEFFEVCADLLNDKGLLILHIGGSTEYDMLSGLTKLSAKRFSTLETVSECVANVERHGIRDKGTTSTHHYLFLEKFR